MAPQNPIPPFARLPNELLDAIIDVLPLVERKTCRLVCKAFDESVNYYTHCHTVAITADVYGAMTLSAMASNTKVRVLGSV